MNSSTKLCALKRFPLWPVCDSSRKESRSRPGIHRRTTNRVVREHYRPFRHEDVRTACAVSYDRNKSNDRSCDEGFIMKPVEFNLPNLSGALSSQWYERRRRVSHRRSGGQKNAKQYRQFRTNLKFKYLKIRRRTVRNSIALRSSHLSSLISSSNGLKSEHCWLSRQKLNVTFELFNGPRLGCG